MTCIQENNISSVYLADVQDILEIMCVQESTTYARDCDVDELNALWRRLLIEWMYYVVDFCKLQRRSVGAASFFLDVTMSQGLIETREEYQLAAATALQLSLKTFDTAIIKLEKLVQLGRGSFTEEDVVRMEGRILNSLKWHLHPPSLYCFQSQYELLLPRTVGASTREMIGEMTKLLSELAVCDHRYNSYPPSLLAYATMLLAMEFIDHVDLPVHQRHCFVIRMSTVAKQNSKSPLVMKAFEELKVSLDSSSKLPELMKSLSLARTKKVDMDHSPRSKSKSFAQTKDSPRHVMARISNS